LEDQLRKNLKESERQQHSIKLEIFKIKFQIMHGSIVIGRDDKEYKVVNISSQWGIAKPWIEANPRKKDGTFGTARRNLYDYWTLKIL